VKVERPFDYARDRVEYVMHHERYKRRVKAEGLTCQACGGRGCIGYDSIYDGPAEPCGWCETTGLVTRWMRGFWLRYMRQCKSESLALARG
jgi:hypothetical protein